MKQKFILFSPWLLKSPVEIVNLRKLETGVRTNRSGVPCTLLLRIEAIGLPTLGFYCSS